MALLTALALPEELRTHCQVAMRYLWTAVWPLSVTTARLLPEHPWRLLQLDVRHLLLPVMSHWKWQELSAEWSRHAGEASQKLGHVRARVAGEKLQSTQAGASSQLMIMCWPAQPASCSQLLIT